MAGFSTTLRASRSMKRLMPVIGSITAAMISRVMRLLPVSVVSLMSHAERWNISPRVIPPSVVMIRSFSEGLWRSARYSQVMAPSAASGADSQKLRPLPRPAEK